jgi:hypothetical protein
MIRDAFPTELLRFEIPLLLLLALMITVLFHRASDYTYLFHRSDLANSGAMSLSRSPTRYHRTLVSFIKKTPSPTSPLSPQASQAQQHRR